jgi:hypothetical protein
MTGVLDFDEVFLEQESFFLDENVVVLTNYVESQGRNVSCHTDNGKRRAKHDMCKMDHVILLDEHARFLEDDVISRNETIIFLKDDDV